MQDDLLFPGLWRSFSDKEVANYLGVEVCVVRKYFTLLGGLRLGRKFVFFEKVLSDAIQGQIRGLDSADKVSRGQEEASLPFPERSLAVGKTGKGSLDGARLADPHALLA